MGKVCVFVCVCLFESECVCLCDQEAARAFIRYSLSPCSLVKMGAFL